MDDPKPTSWYKKLHWQILLGMLLGAIVGIPLGILGDHGVVSDETVGTVALVGHEIGGLFLRLLKMIVVPLVVASLVTGVTGTGSLGGLGRMGWRTFAYYISTSLLAIVVGLVMVNVVSPGEGVDKAVLVELAGSQEALPDPVAVEGVGPILWDLVVRLVPPNPIEAMAKGNMLPVIFFSLLLGVFIAKTRTEAGATLARFFSAAFDVMMAMTMFVIKLAPIGVFGFMLDATTSLGPDVFQVLGWYMLTVLLALVIHAVVTLPVLLRLLGRRSPVRHLRDMTPALLTAFSTASSNGTLPLTITCIEDNAHVDNRVSSFVLPLGATINMDGTALYEAVAVLFIAQLYGLDLGLGQQVVVAITALLASIGAAAIPHAGLVMMVIVLGAVGLPLDAVGLIIAVDRVLDMARTTVNVWSDSTAAVVIHRSMERADAS